MAQAAVGGWRLFDINSRFQSASGMAISLHGQEISRRDRDGHGLRWVSSIRQAIR